MRKRFWISIVLFFALIVVVSNFTILPVLIGLKPLIHVYHYCSTDTKFEALEYPEKGRQFSGVLSNFEKYKFENNNPDIELCRDFKKNWLKFWYWRDYLTHDRWKIKYCE